MTILSIRTDKAAAEIGLFDGKTKLGYETWEAHRLLAETIHTQIEGMLKGSKLTPKDIQGVVVFQGPGSFTGLRIGLSTANALAYGLNIPIVAKRDPGWLEAGIDALLESQNDKIAVPFYGQPAKTTSPKK